jgi:predicted nucleic acid-binding protein
MVLLLDTNILIDALIKREPYRKTAEQIISLCMEQKCTGYIAFHSIPTIYYIMRKSKYADQRRDLIYNLCQIMEVAGASKIDVLSSLRNESFSDFEDCLQVECAKVANADFIITRNIGDFAHSIIPAILPEDFLLKLEAAHE